MDDQRTEPWEDYSRSRLSRGFSHVVRRNDVAQALRASGATLDSLSFGPPFKDPKTEWNLLFDVYWVGDSKTRAFSPVSGDPRRLLMRWHAVTSSFRARVAPNILDRWLPEACAWAAAAPDRGNVWEATDHRWMLIETDGVLSVLFDEFARR